MVYCANLFENVNLCLIPFSMSADKIANKLAEALVDRECRMLVTNRDQVRYAVFVVQGTDFKPPWQILGNKGKFWFEDHEIEFVLENRELVVRGIQPKPVVKEEPKKEIPGKVKLTKEEKAMFRLYRSGLLDLESLCTMIAVYCVTDLDRLDAMGDYIPTHYPEIVKYMKDKIMEKRMPGVRLATPTERAATMLIPEGLQELLDDLERGDVNP